MGCTKEAFLLAGGLVGDNSGTITTSSVRNAELTANGVAGFVVGNEIDGYIVDSFVYSPDSVITNGENWAGGGFARFNFGKLERVYAVVGEFIGFGTSGRFGGLVGQNGDERSPSPSVGVITDAYALVKVNVTGEQNQQGGLVAVDWTSNLVQNLFWAAEAAGIGISAAGTDLQTVAAME